MREAVVYRAFDADGRLLYVGCTYRFAGRKSQHKRQSEWFAGVARWSLETHPTRHHAEIAELAAIRKESPLHNHNGRFRRSHLDRGMMSVETFADMDDDWKRECHESYAAGAEPPPRPAVMAEWLKRRAGR